jgi:hypothetical protein
VTLLRRTSPRTALRAAVAVLAVSCVVLGGAGTGAASDETTTPCPSPDKAKQFCVTVSDTDFVSRSPAPPGAPLYMEYTVTIESKETTRSLTHTALTATVVDVLDVLEDTTTATAATLVSTTTVPSTPCGPLTPAGTIACDIGRLRPGDRWVGRFLMTTSTNASAVATRTTARVSVDERESDSDDPRDPNQEVRETENDTLYATANAGGTFVPAGIARKFSVPTELSSLEFFSPGTLAFAAFITDFDNDPGRCFPGVPCLQQTTEARFGAGGAIFGATNPIQWIRQILNPPDEVGADNILATHRYDPIVVTANAATDRFTAPKSLANIDGVRFTSTGTLPAPLQPGVDYRVVQQSGLTFKVAPPISGGPINLTSAGTGTITAERVRIIGDTKGEQANSCAATLDKVPSIFAFDVSETEILECVSDTENGYMK